MAYVGFDKLKSKLAGEKGVTNPGALAASIGRKKYGAKAFNHAAATGESMKGMPSHLPKGASLSPKGDLGRMSTREAKELGTFNQTNELDVAGMFKKNEPRTEHDKFYSRGDAKIRVRHQGLVDNSGLRGTEYREVSKRNIDVGSGLAPKKNGPGKPEPFTGVPKGRALPVRGEAFQQR